MTTKDQKIKNYTILKNWKTFHSSHTALTPAMVKINCSG